MYQQYSILFILKRPAFWFYQNISKPYLFWFALLTRQLSQAHVTTYKARTYEVRASAVSSYGTTWPDLFWSLSFCHVTHDQASFVYADHPLVNLRAIGTGYLIAPYPTGQPACSRRSSWSHTTRPSSTSRLSSTLRQVRQNRCRESTRLLCPKALISSSVGSIPVASLLCLRRTAKYPKAAKPTRIFG